MKFRHACWQYVRFTVTLSRIFAIVLVATAISTSAFVADAAPNANSKTSRPNIVFMLADDQGWNGLSVAMHPDASGSKSDVIQTPNLERLAAQGMRFSAAYAPAPVCSPTRISLQTGKSPAQLHWTKAAPPEEGHRLIEPRLIKRISDRETTIGELLRSAGYATAHYGKWHIGGGGPGEHGYDEHDGDTGNEQAFKFEDPNPVDIFGMADRAARFMERSKKSGKPFFIQMSWNALHASTNAKKATLAKYQRLLSGENEKRVSTAAISEDLDEGVGKLLASIDALGLAENTFVIYTSDNGSGGGNKRTGLRGGKGGVWEGGVRVPLIVRGPGVAANSWCHVPVVGYDWFPTFYEWAGVARAQLPTGVEGGSLTELLQRGGKVNVRRPRDFLVFHFPHYQGEDGPQSSIVVGDWKLMKFYEDDRIALFNLKDDLSERRDLAASNADRAAAMHRQLNEYLTAIDAQFPTPNPEFDANSPNRKPARGGKNRPEGKKPKKSN